MAGRDIAGVEIKAVATVTELDIFELRKLRVASGAHFAAAVVLYDGESAVRFVDDLFTAPIRVLCSKL